MHIVFEDRIYDLVPILTNRLHLLCQHLSLDNGCLESSVERIWMRLSSERKLWSISNVCQGFGNGSIKAWHSPSQAKRDSPSSTPPRKPSGFPGAQEEPSHTCSVHSLKQRHLLLGTLVHAQADVKSSRLVRETAQAHIFEY
jgi:hypothetical protein